jgi:sigma-B regulation protein RsbU (phosphoserine phosphatase)
VLTALARHTIAAIVESTGDPVHALRTLNRRLRERAGSGATQLCTITAVTVTGRQARIISAGHPLPLLLRDGRAAAVGSHGLLLGAVEDVRVVADTIELADGDRLLLYTDGVTDTVGAHDRFGEERLLDALGDLAGHGDRDDLAAGLLAALDAFADGEQADDIALVALRDRQTASRPLAA